MSTEPLERLLYWIERIREKYPDDAHGVGASSYFQIGNCPAHWQDGFLIVDYPDLPPKHHDPALVEMVRRITADFSGSRGPQLIVAKARVKPNIINDVPIEISMTKNVFTGEVKSLGWRLSWIGDSTGNVSPAVALESALHNIRWYEELFQRGEMSRGEITRVLLILWDEVSGMFKMPLRGYPQVLPVSFQTMKLGFGVSKPPLMYDICQQIEQGKIVKE